MGVNDDKNLNEYEGESMGKDIGYVSLSFVALLLSQKESNRQINMDKRTRNLNHLVCTPKISLLYNC